MQNMINGKQVRKVYFGKARTCCCGCSGKYHTSQRMITMACNRILAVQDRKVKPDTYMDEDDFVSIEIGARMTTVYFSE